MIRAISNQKNALDIKIRETILTKVSTVKFLGVTLDENLTFKDHINYNLFFFKCWSKFIFPTVYKNIKVSLYVYGVLSRKVIKFPKIFLLEMRLFWAIFKIVLITERGFGKLK